MLTDPSRGPAVLGHQGTAVVAFVGRSSTPCHTYGAVLDEVLRAAPSDVRLLCVDIEDAPLTARRYDVSVLPTVLVFRGGVLRHRLVGSRSAERLGRELCPHLR